MLRLVTTTNNQAVKADFEHYGASTKFKGVVAILNENCGQNGGKKIQHF